MRITKVKCPGCGPRLAKSMPMSISIPPRRTTRRDPAPCCPKAEEPYHNFRNCYACARAGT